MKNKSRNHDRISIENRRPRPPRVRDYDDDYDFDDEFESRSMKNKWDDLDWNIAPDSADEEGEVAINVFGYFFIGCGVLGVLGHIMGV